jgi:hypothetical protein
MSKSSKVAFVTRAQQLLAGTKKHFANAGTLSFSSGSVTPAQIEASLQTLIDLRQGVDAAKAASKARINDEATQAPPLLRQLTEFQAFVRVTFAHSPDVLADFGLQPRKAPTPLTVEQKAAAAAKAKATRAARHTMGKQQKKAVKGTTPPVVSPSPSSPVATGPAAGAPSPGAVVVGAPHGT